nr:unnamed protein product [Callosobruchus chinensis]
MQGAKYYIYLSVICAYASGIASLFKTSTFKQVLDTLNSVDDMLRKTNCKKKVSYKKVIMYQVAYMIVENASLLSVMVICCSNLSLELCAIVIYPEILQKVALYQFCFSVEAVYMRSFILNDEVKSFHKRMIEEPLASSIQRTKLLMKIHMTLLNVANEISTIFNVSNFVLFMNGVVLLILSIYYIYWKTKRLGIYIHKFLIYNESPELEKEMLIFSEQVLYNGYIYTVGGLFRINGVIVLKVYK